MPNDKPIFDRAPALIREAAVFTLKSRRDLSSSFRRKGAKQAARNPRQKTVTDISGEIKGINQANRSEQETK